MKQSNKQPEWMTGDRRDPVYDQAAGCAKVVIISIGVVFAIGLIGTIAGVAFLRGGF
ncbi:hypothetical protein AAY80_247 [Stenotrophomonas phage vB_SmaS-DLP_6]|nr:hypothetical protein AAY80_247 [Stenotrophomonas phage vB_SmaS-DLP_6]